MLSLITGVGAKGQVGETVAGALARRGDTVLLVSRDATEVRARANEIVESGGRAQGYPCDLSDAAAVSELAALIRSEHGDGLDNLVNLAGGFASSGKIADSDPAQFARMWQINTSTAYLVTRAFMPLLMSAKGAIVFFASEAVLEGMRSSGVSAYAASKAAVIAIMRSVADEGRGSGVRANAVAPSTVRTASNQGSMGKEARYIEREDVAAAVAFLCSPESKVLTGQVVRLR